MNGVCVIKGENMLKRAFTLAEVLITLTIIGIVAAITIPSVVANAHQQEFKTGLKKAVSSLDQAVALNIAIENETPYENSNLFTYLQRHMTVIKNSTTGVHNGIANYNAYGSGSRSVVKNMTFYTKDGMRYEVYQGSFPYKMYESGYTSWYANNGRCGDYGLKTEGNSWTDNNYPCVVMVDVNGDRKPHPKANVNNDMWSDSYPSAYGTTYTDIFAILITKDGAVPYGTLAQKVMYESQQ